MPKGGCGGVVAVVLHCRVWLQPILMWSWWAAHWASCWRQRSWHSKLEALPAAAETAGSSSYGLLSLSKACLQDGTRSGTALKLTCR